MSPLEWLNPNLHHTMRHPCNDMQHGAMQHGMPCIMPRTIPPCNLPFIASSIMPCSVPMAAHRMLVLLSRKELHARAGFICTTLHIRPPAALDQFSSRRLFLEYTMAPLWRVCRSCVGVVSQSENVQSHQVLERAAYVQWQPSVSRWTRLCPRCCDLSNGLRTHPSALGLYPNH